MGDCRGSLGMAGETLTLTSSRLPSQQRDYDTLLTPGVRQQSALIRKVELPLNKYVAATVQRSFNSLYTRCINALQAAPPKMLREDVCVCIANAFKLSDTEAGRVESNKVGDDKYGDQMMFDREGNAKHTMAKLLASWVKEIVDVYHQANKVQRSATKNMVWAMCFCFCTLGTWLCYLMNQKKEAQKVMEDIHLDIEGYVKQRSYEILLP